MPGISNWGTSVQRFLHACHCELVLCPVSVKTPGLGACGRGQPARAEMDSLAKGAARLSSTQVTCHRRAILINLKQLHRKTCISGMELFLNLCWLALLWPAFLLWQRRTSSSRSARGSLLIVCTLGCVLVLLFPVISASDDLHASAQAIEESKRSLQQGGQGAGSVHGFAHFQPFGLPATAASHPALAHVGAIFVFSPPSGATLRSSRWMGRAPPA